MSQQLSFFDEACTVKDMKEYLDKFNDDESFNLVVVNSQKRLHCIAKEIFLIKDIPAIFMDTIETESMDTEV